jgi:perosamine synthetase
MMVSVHPSATLGEILMPRARADSQSVLNVPGLEFTYNGRGALLRACKEIAHRGKRNILLPAYHCPSGITPAIEAGLTPVFYRIRRDLSIDFDDLRAKVDGHTAAILVIHYFGIAADFRPLQALRERGIALIEDWSHSFLHGTAPTLSGGDSDYRVYSFWKLVPSAVGGGLWRRRSACAYPCLALPLPFSPLRERVIRVKRLIEEALNHSNHTLAKAVFMRLESMRLALRHSGAEQGGDADASLLPGESYYPFDLTLANCRMPGLSRRMLEASDFPSLIQKRHANFNQYGKSLNPSDRMKLLYPALPAGACPWAFPVLLAGRGEIDQHWRADGVALYTFGIHLHSALFQNTDATTMADALYLSEHLLCLSIHQGINSAQIEAASNIINQTLMRTENERVKQAVFV